MFSSKKHQHPDSDEAVTPFKIQKTVPDYKKLLIDEGLVLVSEVLAGLDTEGFVKAEEMYERYINLSANAHNVSCAHIMKIIEVTQGDYPPFCRTDFLPHQEISHSDLSEYLKACIVLGNSLLAEKVMDRGVFSNFEMIKLYCDAALPDKALAIKLLETFNMDEDKLTESFTSVAVLLNKMGYHAERLFFIGCRYTDVLEDLSCDLAAHQSFIRLYFEDICKDYLMNNDYQGYESFVEIYALHKPEGPLMDTIFYLIQRGNIDALKFLTKRAEFIEELSDIFMVRTLLLAATGCDTDKGLAMGKFLVEEGNFQPDSIVVESARVKRCGPLADYFESKITRNSPQP